MKPCPFCGGPALLEKYPTKRAGLNRVVITCARSSCQVAPRFPLSGFKGESIETLALACILIWNKRVEDGAGASRFWANQPEAAPS